MAQKFDDRPYGISDIPDGYVGGLSWDELKTVAEMRFIQAGEPQDKLKAWLDDHQVYPKREENAVRVGGLDWFQMVGLMHDIGEWVREKREADHPYGADLA
jgi:hypothetical protein